MTAGPKLAILFVLGLGLSFFPAAPGAADGTLRLDHGIAADLPEGWRLEEAGDDPGDATGRLRARLVCETPECEATQETCTFVLRREPVEGAGDAERLAGLYAEPLRRYARLRAVLKNTSVGAAIRQPLGIVRLGQRDWWVVETDATGNYKSGLFAETVIGGRYLGVICKTCETGEVRHGTARRMLESVRGRETLADTGVR